MANHLTPTELAREAGLERKEVIAKCMELGVPIFQGRIDKTLFLANIGQGAQQRHGLRGHRVARRLRRRAPGPRRHRIALLSSSFTEEERDGGRDHRPSRRTTGSKTIADLLGRAAEQYADRVAVALQGATARGTTSPSPRSGEIVREIGLGLIDLGHRAGRARLPPRQDAPGVDVRATSPIASAGAVVVPDLPDELARGVRVGRGQLRVRRGHLRGRRAGREDRRGPRPPAEPAHDRRDRPRGRHGRRRSRSTRSARAGRGRDAAELEAARRRRHARGHVHDHLHVGDDRPAEGLRPLPRQLPRDARHVRDARRPARPRGDLPLPPPRPRLRAAHPAAVVDVGDDDRLLRRRPEARSSPSCRRSSRPTCRASRGSSRRSTRSSWPPSPSRSRRR